MWDIEKWTKRAKESWMTFWLEKLAALVTVAGIGFAVYSLIAIQEERKIWYWTLLTTPAPGNSGKIEALEYLAKQGVSLTSIDLSCRAMGGEEPVTGPKKTKCKRPVYLKGLDLSKKIFGKRADLSGADLSYANLIEANLSDANLSDAGLSGANLRRAKLSDADLSDADLSDANLSIADLRSANLRDANLISADLISADLSDADLRYADLVDASLFGANLRSADLRRADLRSADLSDANLSDTDFKNATFSSDTTFTNAWAWADEQPRNLPAKIDIQLCKYNKGSSRYRHPNSCIPPDTK